MASGKFQGEIAANTPRPCRRELVLLAGRSLEPRGERQISVCASRRRIAEMIHRLAQIALGIRKRLARLAHHQRHETRRGRPRTDRRRDRAAPRAPRRRAGPIPVTGRLGRGKRLVDGLGRSRVRQTPTTTLRSCGEVIQRTSPPSSTSLPETIGLAAAGSARALLHCAQQWRAHLAVPQRQAETVRPLRQEQIRRRRDQRIGLLGQRRSLLRPDRRRWRRSAPRRRRAG